MNRIALLQPRRQPAPAAGTAAGWGNFFGFLFGALCALIYSATAGRESLAAEITLCAAGVIVSGLALRTATARRGRRTRRRDAEEAEESLWLQLP